MISIQYPNLMMNNTTEANSANVKLNILVFDNSAVFRFSSSNQKEQLPKCFELTSAILADVIQVSEISLTVMNRYSAMLLLVYYFSKECIKKIHGNVCLSNW